MNSLKLSQKSKIYLKAFGLLGVLVVVGIVVVRLAITQIPAQKNKVAVQLSREQALRQKTELLKSIEPEAPNQAQLISFVLPSQNSSFIAISQIKLLAAQNLIVLTNLKIGGEIKESGLSSSDISFDGEGTLPSALNLLKGINNVSPLMVIEKVQINQSQNIARATVRLKVFWAELPKTLPKITEPIKDLTNEEKEILTRVFKLTPPEFVLLEPEAPRENTNPF